MAGARGWDTPRRAARGSARKGFPTPTPPSSTNRTRCLPHPVLIGHAAPLTPWLPCRAKARTASELARLGLGTCRRGGGAKPLLHLEALELLVALGAGDGKTRSVTSDMEIKNCDQKLRRRRAGQLGWRAGGEEAPGGAVFEALRLQVYLQRWRLKD